MPPVSLGTQQARRRGGSAARRPFLGWGISSRCPLLCPRQSHGWSRCHGVGDRRVAGVTWRDQVAAQELGPRVACSKCRSGHSALAHCPSVSPQPASPLSPWDSEKMIKCTRDSRERGPWSREGQGAVASRPGGCGADWPTPQASASPLRATGRHLSGQLAGGAGPGLGRREGPAGSGPWPRWWPC